MSELIFPGVRSLGSDLTVQHMWAVDTPSL